MVPHSPDTNPLEREGAKNVAGCLLFLFVLAGLLSLAYSIHVLTFRSRLMHEGIKTTGIVSVIKPGRFGPAANVSYTVKEHTYLLQYGDLFQPLDLGQKVALRYLPSSPVEAIVVMRSVPSSVVLAFFISALFLSSSIQMFLRLRTLDEETEGILPDSPED